MNDETTPEKVASTNELGQLPKRDIVERLREISSFRAAILEQTGAPSNLPCIKADAANEIERLRGLLYRQYRADASLYGMPHDCTEEQHRQAATEHDAVHLLLAAEFETDSKPAISVGVP